MIFMCHAVFAENPLLNFPAAFFAEKRFNVMPHLMHCTVRAADSLRSKVTTNFAFSKSHLSRLSFCAANAADEIVRVYPTTVLAAPEHIFSTFESWQLLQRPG